MFTKNDYILFFTAGLLIFSGFILMAVDPAENGFGILTLWIAPPLLLTGFLMPILGIVGFGNSYEWAIRLWHRKSLKNLMGAVVFVVTFINYLFTLEPTASLWDCSEFIASSYKLQVPHTPGTPLSLLIGRLFTMLAFGDVFKVAWSLNLMSAFFSALTVSTVYYLILFFGDKIFPAGKNHSDYILILSAFSGSLCLAFSDTFWFSAVEAETYGPACFFLVMLVLLILEGSELEEPFRSRRLVLIFYLAGLSYCIHPMCLLALPILPFVWSTKWKIPTLTNTILAVSAGLAIVLIINRFVAIGVFQVAFLFDRFFVNNLNLPFYSGAVILLVFLFFMFRVIVTKYHNARLYAFSVVFLLFGFLPYMILFIRSNHNPPIDESNPQDLALIKAYMNREGYPSSPLLYGPYFDAQISDVRIDKQIYFKGHRSYEIAGSLPEYVYDSRQTLLPRMYSNDPAHKESYRAWTGLKAHEKPSFADNIHFLFTYQIGHMYLRYLMWNFAGRESDIQNSDWLKPWEELHSQRFEHARNQYWMIPLLLGFFGAISQFRKDRKGFVAQAIFFLITGVVLALYLNSPPNEPRERDYIYVGSYIAFSIWIGLGSCSLGIFLSNLKWGLAVAGLLSVTIPVWMW
ncbi:MAG TPA: DUF2723 domain-containing protein, partial [Chryseosolibacter sp.]|nr:DUF2723 domain-containing protein [Chryseosolibacter sp.]